MEPLGLALGFHGPAKDLYHLVQWMKKYYHLHNDFESYCQELFEDLESWNKARDEIKEVINVSSRRVRQQLSDRTGEELLATHDKMIAGLTESINMIVGGDRKKSKAATTSTHKARQVYKALKDDPDIRERRRKVEKSSNKIHHRILRETKHEAVLSNRNAEETHRMLEDMAESIAELSDGQSSQDEKFETYFRASEERERRREAREQQERKERRIMQQGDGAGANRQNMMNQQQRNLELPIPTGVHSRANQWPRSRSTGGSLTQDSFRPPGRQARSSEAPDRARGPAFSPPDIQPPPRPGSSSRNTGPGWGNNRSSPQRNHPERRWLPFRSRQFEQPKRVRFELPVKPVQQGQPERAAPAEDQPLTWAQSLHYWTGGWVGLQADSERADACPHCDYTEAADHRPWYFKTRWPDNYAEWHRAMPGRKWKVESVGALQRFNGDW